LQLVQDQWWLQHVQVQSLLWLDQQELEEQKQAREELGPSLPLPSRRDVAVRWLEEIHSDKRHDIKQKLDMLPYLTLVVDGWSSTQGGDHVTGFSVASPIDAQSNYYLDKKVCTTECVTGEYHYCCSLTHTVKHHGLRVFHAAAVLKNETMMRHIIRSKL
jgi:hypothetical protein